MSIRFTLQGPLPSEDELPTGLGPGDAGKIWWIGWTWHIWDGNGWRQAIATRTAPQ